MIMSKIKVTQRKSVIGSTHYQKKTMKALGLRRINHSVEKEVNPQIMGMVEKVRHLVLIEEIN